MEPSQEIFQPWRLYARAGWAALAGSLVCVLCGIRAPLALIPASLCAATGLLLFWLSARPIIRISKSQLNIGERAIAWSEIREVNSTAFLSPRVMRLRLTNSRKKTLVYPGEPERIAYLTDAIRKCCYLASFDGVAYRDLWTWQSTAAASGEDRVPDHPVRMLNQDDEDEIERMYLTLKTVGRLDARGNDANPDSHED